MLSSWKIQVLKVMKFFIWIICRWNLIFRGKIDSDYFICRVYIYLKFVKWICYNNVQNEIFLYNFRIEIFIFMNVNFIHEKTLHDESRFWKKCIYFLFESFDYFTNDNTKFENDEVQIFFYRVNKNRRKLYKETTDKTDFINKTL